MAESTGGKQERSARGSLRWWQLEIPALWIRFLLALAGLGLALAAALFSTVARESGNFWATLVLASLALLLVALVGLTTLPHLARRALGGRLRESFDYQVTRVGIFYVLVVLLIGIAALNTGNNLLYLIVAAMIAGILVSGLASGVMLRGLAVDLQVTERVFAGQTLSAVMALSNRRRWLPAFSVSVLPLDDRQGRDRGAPWRWNDFTRGARAEKIRLAKEAGRAPGLVKQSIYFPYLAPGESLPVALELSFARRGRYEQQGFGLSTRFPFAFLVKTRRVALARAVIALPKIEPEEGWRPLRSRLEGDVEAFVPGGGQELYRIREYLAADSVRHVDWKATAKSGSLKVREFSRQDDRGWRIFFDNPSQGMLSAAGYERAVSIAASLAWYLAGERGRLRFALTGGDSGSDLDDFLLRLALIEPAPRGSEHPWPPADGELNIIVTARPPSGLDPDARIVRVTDLPGGDGEPSRESRA